MYIRASIGWRDVCNVEHMPQGTEEENNVTISVEYEATTYGLAQEFLGTPSISCSSSNDKPMK